MPRLGAEPKRKKSLVEAAIRIIGEEGSLDVPVKKIALDAGMSSGLAFHYFGDKDRIIVEAMRHLLGELARDLSTRLKAAKRPGERLNAIFETSFGPTQFDKNTVSAWLVFYCQAQRSSQLARLHHIYSRRLRSNLLAELKKLQSANEAEQTAQILAAMIDGLYIQLALHQHETNPGAAIGLCHKALARLIPADASADKEQAQ